MSFKYNDGGRKEAGYKGDTGDCVARSIAIASGLPYQVVYDTLAHGNLTQRKSKHTRSSDNKRTAAHGILTRRKWFKDYMKSLGFKWRTTMYIGSGCKVHLSPDELPKGNLIIAVSKHYTAMIDGVINDTFDPRRQDESGRETRCVYGYWEFDQMRIN